VGIAHTDVHFDQDGPMQIERTLSLRHLAVVFGLSLLVGNRLMPVSHADAAEPGAESEELSYYENAIDPNAASTSQPSLEHLLANESEGIPQLPLESQPDAVTDSSLAPVKPAQAGPKCDKKKCQALEKAVAGAHKNLFYDNDFSYLCDPCYNDHWFGDALKRNCLGECASWDIGGQYRLRQQSENNFRGAGLTGRNDDFLLHRTRLYANVEYSDLWRVYAEMIDAESNFENFPPRSIEVNRTDMLNLFGDYKYFTGSAGDAWARVGRQELQYGAQRLVSPLDWANTRRTFDGYKSFYKGEEWDCDAFYTRPVAISPYAFDNPSYDREFGGIYSTYKGWEKETVDLYYLLYNNQIDPFHYNTFGARYLNTTGPLLVEVEGAYQSGEFRGNNHNAGFWVAGLGHQWNEATWKPTLWVYYDWASGDDIIGNGFDQLFPLAHKYLGYMDLFGRRNIKDINAQLTLQPHKQLQLLLWYHYFRLQNANDVPYSVNMVPYNPANLPASTDLGHEIDLTASWNFTPRTNVLLGYSHFFSGEYYKLTPGVPYRGDANFFYTQVTWNF
jgi:hypothetical protein